MKTYKVVLLAVLGLVIVVGASYMYMKDKPVAQKAAVASETETITGEVVRVFEGENKVSYTLAIPKTATSSIGMDGALVKIVDSGSPYVSMYFSFEGGRGYTARDYINNVIAPRVSGLTMGGTTTIGLSTWQVAQTAQSEWHVAQVGDGQWLLIVESKRALHDRAVETLDSLTVK
jgi:hypothetical protein